MEPLQTDPTLEMSHASPPPRSSEPTSTIRTSRKSWSTATATRCIFRERRFPTFAAALRQPRTWGHVGLYVYRRACLLRLASLPPTDLERSEALEQLRALEHGIRIKAIETSHEAIGVDTPDDLERVRRLFERQASQT